jgi:hypothetical protein
MYFLTLKNEEMEKIMTTSIKMLAGAVFTCMFLASCEYQKIEDADYPDQKLYMPAAVNGVYTISNVPQAVGATPTAGMAYRFTVDVQNNKLTVPLAVYRSGINFDGEIPVAIAAISDTITELAALSKVPVTTAILPAGKYTLPLSVNIANGQELGTFNLDIDLTYLRSFPDAILGLGVGVSSEALAVNPLYRTTVLVLYTKILKPVAGFTSKADANNAKKIVFTNTSTYGMTYSWDFGDSTAASTEKAPSHTYASAGVYNVTLTVYGVTGGLDKSVKTVSTTVL